MFFRSEKPTVPRNAQVESYLDFLRSLSLEDLGHVWNTSLHRAEASGLASCKAEISRERARRRKRKKRRSANYLWSSILDA